MTPDVPGQDRDNASRQDGAASSSSMVGLRNHCAAVYVAERGGANAFAKKCKRDACEPKAVSTDGKPLAGAAKNSF
jgi:hypothetical protein